MISNFTINWLLSSETKIVLLNRLIYGVNCETVIFDLKNK